MRMAYSFLIDANNDEFARFPPTNVRDDVQSRNYRSSHRLKPTAGGHGPTSAPGISRRGIQADAVSSFPRLSVKRYPFPLPVYSSPTFHHIPYPSFITSQHHADCPNDAQLQPGTTTTNVTNGPDVPRRRSRRWQCRWIRRCQPICSPTRVPCTG